MQEQYNNNNNSNNSYIYGKNAVREAILSGENIEKIYLCYGTGNDQLQVLAKRNKIACVTYDKSKFKALEMKSTPRDAKTQGIIALKQLVKTFELQEFLSTLDTTANPVLAILNGIEDPQNLGAIARSAECAGVSAIILPTNHSATITPTAIKASAGALNHIAIISVTNLIHTIEILKDAGFWIVGTDMDGKEDYSNNIYDKPTAIIIGSEGKGISPSLIKHCDHIVKIDMYGKINSLNASVTAGIIFFEIMRQRKM
ncbi:MAG: 23S rRNA (guanosine(2251)-2'-O)-methyltransferase RlmB [Ignavibacteria bacterium]|jgi:23S rRNA (guanosine2251-2'-O)-methyltransferase|nr:23S rRNA (guanosine(2251)-2'-O)-methyltransferase RlmB [Ignavibacteria bacterium]